MAIDKNQNPLFQKMARISRRSHPVKDSHINLSHGSGGKAMSDLINNVS